MSAKSPTSLMHLALAKTAILLWNRDESWTSKKILEKVSDRTSQEISNQRKQWQVIEDNIVIKATKLPVPIVIQEELSSFVQPIGWEIWRWIRYHEWMSPYSGIKIPEILCWTSLGTVDKKKTAEILTMDQSLDITIRYQLACSNCLEHHILDLWSKMPETSRIFFYYEDPQSYHQKLVLFWTYLTAGQLSNMHKIDGQWRATSSIYLNALKLAVEGVNEEALKYFCQKLTPQEREESLVEMAEILINLHSNSHCHEFRSLIFVISKAYHASMLSYLLSQMNVEQKTRLFRMDSEKVMDCLSDWPNQSHYIVEVANPMWDLFSGEGYAHLFAFLVRKMNFRDKYHYYQKLIRNILQQIPDVHREEVADACLKAKYNVFYYLFHLKDREAIRFIFKNATTAQKKDFIFSEGGDLFCTRFLTSSNREELELILRECILAKKDMISFKKKYLKLRNKSKFREFSSKKKTWNQFFQVLNKLIAGMDG